MGGLFLVVKFHRGGSVTNGATSSSFHIKSGFIEVNDDSVNVANLAY